MNTLKEEMKISLRKIKPLVLLLGGGVLFVLVFQAALSFFIPETGVQPKWNSQKKQTASIINAFDNISLEAKAAYVFDLNTQEVLFALNENERLPLASVTKLMTAFVARDHASESAVVTISRDDIAAEGDSGLHGGERWRMGDLLGTMLIISSNDAAHAIARFIGGEGQPAGQEDQLIARTHFIQEMNAKAQELGFKSMEFFNESGLDIERDSKGVIAKNGLPAIASATAGGYGSAHDVALLFAELWKKYPSTVEITTLPDARVVSQDNIVHILPNTDEAIGKFSGLIASKTGYTTLAGGNLTIIFDKGINHPIVAVVLGSSQKGRFDDMARLVVAAGKDTAVRK